MPTSFPWRIPCVGSCPSQKIAQHLLVARARRVEDGEHGLGVTGAARARLLVGRVRREAAGVADGGRVDAGRLPEEALGAPEAAHADDDPLEAVGEGRQRSACRGRGGARRPASRSRVRVAPTRRSACRLGLAEEEAHASTVAGERHRPAQACASACSRSAQSSSGSSSPTEKPEQAARDPVAFPAVTRLELRVDGAEARRVLDRAHGPLDATRRRRRPRRRRRSRNEKPGYRSTSYRRVRARDARQARAPSPPGGRGERRASAARVGAATPSRARRRSRSAGASGAAARRDRRRAP